MCSVLRQVGVKTYYAACTNDILNYLHCHQPGLVVVNMELSKTNVWDLLKKTRKLKINCQAPVPAIITTSYTEDEDLFRADEFQQMVENVLKLHHGMPATASL